MTAKHELTTPSNTFRLARAALFVFFTLDKLCGKKLESHRPVEIRVNSFIDHTHSALAKFVEDAVVGDLAADHKVYVVSPLNAAPSRSASRP